MKDRKGLLVNSISLVIVFVIAVVVAIVIYSLVTEYSMAEIVRMLAFGAFGSIHNITESLIITTPLILAGLGVVFAFKCGLWNIGAEGQLYLGAIGATFVALNLSAPAPLHMFVIIVSAFALGGAWSVIAGTLKVRLGINEILTTIMMNFIAVWIVHYLVHGPWWDRSLTRPQTSLFPESAWLPILVSGSRLHAGLIIGFVCAAITFIIFKYTKLGYSIKLIGTNPKAALYSGINLSKTMISSMFISGGLSGLAGMSLVCGIYHYLINGQYQISPGYGYYAIGVALLGGLSSVGTVVAGVFFGFLMGAASHLKAIAGMHAESLLVIVGLILIAVLARNIFAEQLRRLPGLRGKE